MRACGYYSIGARKIKKYFLIKAYFREVDRINFDESPLCRIIFGTLTEFINISLEISIFLVIIIVLIYWHGRTYTFKT